MFNMKKITRPRIRAFLSKHATDGMVIDIGSGDDYYKDLFPNKLNIDIDPKRNPDIVGDVCCLPFDNDSVDGILNIEVLEHVSDPRGAVDEMFRVLKPGGKLILTTRFAFPIHDAPGDFFRYTKYGLKNLFDKWEIESVEEESASFEAVAVILQRLMFQTKFKCNRFVKVFLLALIYCIFGLQRLVKREYGNIKQTVDETNILTSGYYLIAHKPKSE